MYERLLRPFASYPALQARLTDVLHALPQEVIDDFRSDERFTMALDDFSPMRGRRVWLPSPGSVGEDTRVVVLKARLNHCDERFALYIIAHELAHAYLRNGGWGEITDREQAADALAASWGFEKVR